MPSAHALRLPDDTSQQPLDHDRTLAAKSLSGGTTQGRSFSPAELAEGSLVKPLLHPQTTLPTTKEETLQQQPQNSSAPKGRKTQPQDACTWV